MSSLSHGARVRSMRPGGAGLGTDRAGVFNRPGFGHENLAASRRWRLVPRHVDHVAAVRFRLDRPFCIGKFDDQSVRSDLDADDMIADESCVSSSSPIA